MFVCATAENLQFKNINNNGSAWFFGLWSMNYSVRWPASYCVYDYMITVREYISIWQYNN